MLVADESAIRPVGGCKCCMVVDGSEFRREYIYVTITYSWFRGYR